MASDVKTDLLPTPLNDAERAAILRRALTTALRAVGHSKLVAHEAESTQKTPSQVWAAVWALLLLWLPASAIGSALDWPVKGWLLLSAGLLAGIVVASRIVRPDWLPIALLVVGAPIWVVLQANESAFLYSHVVPIVIVVVISILERAVNAKGPSRVGATVAGVFSGVPLLLPLAMAALTFPALSAEPWQLASKLDAADFALLAVFVVAPLYVLVARHLLRNLEGMMETRVAQLLSDASEGPELTRRLLRDFLSPQAAKLVFPACDDQFGAGWPRSAQAYTPLIAAVESSKFRNPVFVRLLLTAFAVGAAFFGYMYGLVAIIVDPAVAEQWSDSTVPLLAFEVGGFSAYIPGGAYLNLSALIGILATAIFLAFTLLEERFSRALASGLVHGPADDLLGLAVPYLALREAHIGFGESRFDDVDVEEPYGSA